MTARVLGLVTAAAVLVADQLSKWAIIHPIALPERAPIDLLPIFRLIWVENRGVSMGFFVAGSSAERWALAGVTAAIALGVLVWLCRENGRADALALGAILGGAIGNIADRVRLGYVADFLNLHFGAWSPFLVFNVADAAISIGVVLLALRALFVREGRPSSENANV